MKFVLLGLAGLLVVAVSMLVPERPEPVDSATLGRLVALDRLASSRFDDPEPFDTVLASLAAGFDSQRDRDAQAVVARVQAARAIERERRPERDIAVDRGLERLAAILGESPPAAPAGPRLALAAIGAIVTLVALVVLASRLRRGERELAAVARIAGVERPGVDIARAVRSTLDQARLDRHLAAAPARPPSPARVPKPERDAAPIRQTIDVPPVLLSPPPREP